MNEEKLVIAVSKGHNVFNNKIFDNGASFNGVMEAEKVSLTVNILIPMLRSQGHIVVDVTPWREHFPNSKAAHQERAKRVNEGTIIDGKRVPFDLYLDLHLNSGGGTGPEMWVYSTKGLSYEYARKLVNNIVADTKLRNRGVKVKPTMWSLSMPKPPSIIVEGGFIDSKADMKVLTPQLYAESIAKAFGELPKHEKTEISHLYKVQVGAYSVKSNAEALLKDLENKGFKGFIVEENKEVEVIPNKPKKLVSYKGPKGSEIIEIDPLDLYIEVNKSPRNSIKGDFINGSFYDMNKMVSISTLVSNGKVLAEQLPHDQVKRGTLVVRKNRTVSVEMVDFISKSPGLDSIKFAIGGFNILPSHGDLRKQLKSEWFDYNVVGYKTWRSMLGYSNKANKVLAVIVPNMTAEEGQALMKELGCDCGIGLDSGGSTSARFNGKDIRLVNRVIHNIIRW